jgi:hypothetical protein
MAASTPQTQLTAYLASKLWILKSTHSGHTATMGASAGKVFNPYYLVSDGITEFYVCQVNGDNNTSKYTLISIDSINKFLSMIDSTGQSTYTPTWYMCSNGYVATNNKGKYIYLHQHLMDLHGQKSGADLTAAKRSVDHINRDPLDNRLANLRIVDSQTEQNLNQGKKVRAENNLPPEFALENNDLPKYIQYKAEYEHNGAKHGAQFLVEIKVCGTKTKIVKKSTKAKDKSLYYKLIQAIKLRYQIITGTPSNWEALDIPNQAYLAKEWTAEQHHMITTLAKSGAIPVTSQVLDLSLTDFPDMPDISKQLAELADTQAEASDLTKQVKKAESAARRKAKESERGACPDCNREIVIKTLPRHQRNFCPNRPGAAEDMEAKKVVRVTKMKVTKAVNSKRKISDEDIIAIRALRDGGLTMAAIGVRYGLSHQYVSDVCKGIVPTQADKLIALQESLLAK